MGKKKRSKHKKKGNKQTLKSTRVDDFSFPEILLYFGLALMTLVVFAQTLDFSFINYDDDDYVYNNHMVLRGLSWSGLAWAFTSQLHDHWHPLTWLSHMLDCQLFGLKAGWHHTTNLLFHLFNTLLLYYLLNRVTGYRWRAWLVSVFFAIHPLHVESVVWVAARKDVLSGFFFFLCLLAYILYVQNKSKKWYMLVLLAGLCGMMAKSILVTLPFVLLLLDHWPLQRQVRITSGGEGVLATYRQPQIWIEKIPLFIISICVSGYMVLLHADRLHETSREFLPFFTRLGRAVDSYIVYLSKFFWPSRLTIAYLYEFEPQVWWVVSAGVVLLLLSLGAIYFSGSRPYLFVGWFWYLGTLVPVSGLVSTGPQVLAYRYTYLSLIGLIICLVWGVGEVLTWHRRSPLLKWASILGLGACIVASMALTYTYTSNWRDSRTLYSHLVKYSPNNYVIKLNLALAYSENNKYTEAFRIYKQLLSDHPENPKVLDGFVLLLARNNDPEILREAQGLLRKSLALEPKSISQINLGIILAKLGDWDAAAEELKKATDHHPLRAKAHFNYGLVLLKLGKMNAAKKEFQQALFLEPNYQRADEQLNKIQKMVDK